MEKSFCDELLRILLTLGSVGIDVQIGPTEDSGKNCHLHVCNDNVSGHQHTILNSYIIVTST